MLIFTVLPCRDVEPDEPMSMMLLPLLEALMLTEPLVDESDTVPDEVVTANVVAAPR